jgi:hypothetical protein
MKEDLMGSASRLSYNNAASALDPLDIVHRSSQIMGLYYFHENFLNSFLPELVYIKFPGVFCTQKKKAIICCCLFIYFVHFVCGGGGSTHTGSAEHEDGDSPTPRYRPDGIDALCKATGS